MYTWNGLKIHIDGKNHKLISDIRKYFYASYSMISGDDCDITFSIYDTHEKIFPPLNKNSRLVKSRNLFLEKEFELKIYEHKDELWYFYHDIAGIWFDFKGNKIIVSLSDKLFSFPYYNILFFFLYPLGLLLENLGYYRLHASCVDIEGRAVLFSGISGSGKSTAAFASASHGGDIVSDDVTFIKKIGDSYKVCTITKLVKLHGDTITRFFPELLIYKHIKNHEGDMYFDVNNVNSGLPTHSVLDSIVILEKTGIKSSNSNKIHPSRVVPHLFPSSIQINNNKFTHQKFNFLTGLLNDIPCYKVRFGVDMLDFYKNIKSIVN